MFETIEVIRLVKEGTSFGAVEDYINELPLSEEERSVLWLLAWSELERPERYRVMLTDA